MCMNLEDKPEEAPRMGSRQVQQLSSPQASQRLPEHSEGRDGAQPEVLGVLGLCLLLVPQPTQLKIHRKPNSLSGMPSLAPSP